MMTQTIKRIGAMLIFLLALGCSDDFLKREPITSYNPDGYYSTTAAALQGLYGVYDMLQKDGTYNRYIWSVVHGRSDDGNEAAGDSYDRLKDFSDDPTTPAHNEGWIMHYQGITRANSLLDGLEASTTIPEADKSRIIGETKFLRALYYFNLVNIFGGVPVITTTLSPADANIPRNTITEVYALIESDLTDAIAALPLLVDLPTVEKGRATRGSAQTLLARAYLYQEKYSEAAAAALDVIDSDQYILTPGEAGFRSNFLISGENGPESIFEVQYSDANATKGWAQEEGNEASNWLRPGFIGGWSGEMFHKSFREQNTDRSLPLQGIDPTDPRRKYTLTVPNTNLPLDGDAAYMVPDGTAPQTSAKHWSSKQQYGYNDEINWIVLRYAEVLLIRAESLIESNTALDEATNRINEVRARVGFTPIGAGKTQAELRDILRYERRIELAQEGTRFWDLRRWNLLEVAMDVDHANKNYLPKFEYAPIPQNQIDLSQNVLIQNDGY